MVIQLKKMSSIAVSNPRFKHSIASQYLGILCAPVKLGSFSALNLSHDNSYLIGLSMVHYREKESLELVPCPITHVH